MIRVGEQFNPAAQYQIKGRNMRECYKCLTEKKDEYFPWRDKEKGVRRGFCRDCQNAETRKHYRKYREKYLEKSRDAKEKIKQWYEEYLSTLECSQCGENHPAALDFHHLRDKEFNISQAVGDSYSVRRIEAEIEKCIVLCANCHRKHHYNERLVGRVLVWDERALSTP